MAGGLVDGAPVAIAGERADRAAGVQSLHLIRRGQGYSRVPWRTVWTTTRSSSTPCSARTYAQPNRPTGAGFARLRSSFERRFPRLISNLLNPVRKKTDKERSQWNHLPFLFCGGGRNVGLYRGFVESLNRNRSYHVRLNEIELEPPAQLVGHGLGVSEFYRIAVAYGLSFRDVGNYTTTDQIDPIDENDTTNRAWRNEYVENP